MRVTRKGYALAALAAVSIGFLLPVNRPGALPRCGLAPVAGIACQDIDEAGHHFTLDADGNLTYADPELQASYEASITQPGTDSSTVDCWTVDTCTAEAGSTDESEPLGPDTDESSEG